MNSGSYMESDIRFFTFHFSFFVLKFKCNENFSFKLWFFIDKV